MFKKETVPIVCSSSMQTQVHFWAAGRKVATRVSTSLAQLSFCSLQMPDPSSTLGRAPVLLLLSPPKREGFSIWQLGIRLLAGFPPFAPLDLTMQDSCLPGPYAVPGRIYH